MFASHLRFAAIGDHVIQLDIAQDRYRRLEGRLACAILTSRERPPTPPEEAILRAAGVLAIGEPGRPFAPIYLPPAIHEALQGSAEHREVRLGALGPAALARARTLLAVTGFASVLRRVERSARAMSHSDDDRAADIARGFERSRQWFPARRRCLPDGIALHRILADAGIRATLVIGVRDTPFAAHCWLQAGSWLLTDTQDMVAELTPILTI